MLKYKVETGMQLVTRLYKKDGIENFYPQLFNSGPNFNDFTEISCENDYGMSLLLSDVISECLYKTISSSSENGGVLIFNTNENFNFDLLLTTLKLKISQKPVFEKKSEDLLLIVLKNLHIMDIYDSNQLYTTIHNLENVLLEKRNISLVVFDSITAFYWSEQAFRIMKMDTYLKNLLLKIEKITKEYKVSIIYTKPKYFTSKTKEYNECYDTLSRNILSYQIKVQQTGNNCYEAEVRNSANTTKNTFSVINNQVKWQ